MPSYDTFEVVNRYLYNAALAVTPHHEHHYLTQAVNKIRWEHDLATCERDVTELLLNAIHAGLNIPVTQEELHHD